jgi:hypothetical protein
LVQLDDKATTQRAKTKIPWSLNILIARVVMVSSRYLCCMWLSCELALAQGAR